MRTSTTSHKHILIFKAYAYSFRPGKNLHNSSIECEHLQLHINIYWFLKPMHTHSDQGKIFTIAPLSANIYNFTWKRVTRERIAKICVCACTKFQHNQNLFLFASLNLFHVMLGDSHHRRSQLRQIDNVFHNARWEQAYPNYLLSAEIQRKRRRPNIRVENSDKET